MIVSLNDLNFTPEQRRRLSNVLLHAEMLEDLGVSGRERALVSIVIELCDGVISPDYLKEKLNILFDYHPLWSTDVESHESAPSTRIDEK